jgi:hypothetical protein
MSKPVSVEITDPAEFHCFRMVFNPSSAPGQRIEIMLHARALVELIHEASTALCDWQAQTSSALIQKLSGLTEQEAREAGLIA